GRRGSGARDQPLHPVASPLRLPPALKARAPPEPEKATPEGTRDRSPVGRGPGSISNVALPGAPGSPPDDQRPRARCYLATIGDAPPHRPPKTNSSSGFRRLGARSRSLSAPGNPFGSHGAVYAGLLHARQPPVHARPIGLVVRTEEAAQRGLLVRDHEQVRAPAKEQHVTEERHRVVDDGRAAQRQNCTAVHRVPDEAVWPPHN